MNKATLGLLGPAGPLDALAWLCGTGMMKINEYLDRLPFY
jgi:hypothetical protein